MHTVYYPSFHVSVFLRSTVQRYVRFTEISSNIHRMLPPSGKKQCYKFADTEWHKPVIFGEIYDILSHTQELR
jgi:hypothetical protein